MYCLPMASPTPQTPPLPLQDTLPSYFHRCNHYGEHFYYFIFLRQLRQLLALHYTCTPSPCHSDTESIARSDSTGLATVQLPCLSDEARLSQTTMVLSSSSSREGQIDGRNKYMAEVSSSSLPSTHQNAHQNVAMRIMHSQQITNSGWLLK